MRKRFKGFEKDSKWLETVKRLKEILKGLKVFWKVLTKFGIGFKGVYKGF